MSFMSDKSILKEGLIDAIVKKLFLNKELKKANPKAKKIKVKKYKV